MYGAEFARDDRGSSAVEFVLVGSLLTALTLAILQLGFAIYVRNILHDAAVTAAFHAALIDTSLREGEQRAEELITDAVGAEYAGDVAVTEGVQGGIAVIQVRVRAPVPLIGFIGVPDVWEVSARAPVESFE